MTFLRAAPYISAALTTLFCLGCSVAKLEARLQANPQCKEIINPKTGVVMPCPGSDHSFYKPADLDQRSNSSAPLVPGSNKDTNPAVAPAIDSLEKQNSALTNTQANSACKPQIHKKTGGTLPCPPTD